ncbi:MAG: GNAT family N-acetyltransferase [Acidobacteria bacterium]|nr:GNAT family N-acetyltransferase [Acidobacteriota bacterium]
MQVLNPFAYDQADKLLKKLDLPVIDRSQEGSRYWGEWQGSQLIGLVGLEVYGHLGLLRSLAVDPARQGTGLGKQLLNHILAQAKDLELEAIYLLTTTARDYFIRFGFAEIERHLVPTEIRASSEFHSVCPSSATVMVWRG